MKKALFLGVCFCVMAAAAQAQYGGYEQRRNVPPSYHLMSPYVSVFGGYGEHWMRLKEMDYLDQQFKAVMPSSVSSASYGASAGLNITRDVRLELNYTRQSKAGADGISTTWV